MFEPDANYDKQAPPDCLRTNPPTRVRCAMTGTALCFRPPQRDRAAFSRRELSSGSALRKRKWNEAIKCKNGNTEREYQDRLEILRKNAFNTQLRPLRSLETATKKRRALKK